MTSKEYLLHFYEKNNGIIVSSLGNISKIISELNYSDWFPVKGGMGCAMGVGLGIALNTAKQVNVIIGDGAFLMKMGSIATILKYNLPNLKIIILNNNKHASCGGQETNFKYIKNFIPFEVIEIDE